MSGIIINGKYVKGGDVSRLSARQQSTFKSHEANRQRQDFAREIIQPFDRSGKPNPDFVQAYPEESKNYGFLPDDKELLRG